MNRYGIHTGGTGFCSDTDAGAKIGKQKSHRLGSDGFFAMI
jgi:hypothetical protein